MWRAFAYNCTRNQHTALAHMREPIIHVIHDGQICATYLDIANIIRHSRGARYVTHTLPGQSIRSHAECTREYVHKNLADARARAISRSQGSRDALRTLVRLRMHDQAPHTALCMRAERLSGIGSATCGKPLRPRARNQFKCCTPMRTTVLCTHLSACVRARGRLK